MDMTCGIYYLKITRCSYLHKNVSRHPMIFLKNFLFHRILIYCLYFSWFSNTLFKITGRTRGTFTIRNFLVIFFLIYTPRCITPYTCWKPICTSLKCHKSIYFCLLVRFWLDLFVAQKYIVDELISLSFVLCRIYS